MASDAAPYRLEPGPSIRIVATHRQIGRSHHLGGREPHPLTLASKLLRPGQDELVEQGVWSQGLPELDLDAWVFGPQGIARGGQVAEQMHPGREEVGNHQEARRPSPNTTIPTESNVGLGKFEKRGLDNRVFLTLGETLGHTEQVVVGGLVPTSMGDQKNRRFCPF